MTWRVIAGGPWVQAHTPLAAAVSAHAMLPPPHAGAADMWAAAAHFLHTLRRAYLAGGAAPHHFFRLNFNPQHPPPTSLESLVQ